MQLIGRLSVKFLRRQRVAQPANQRDQIGPAHASPLDPKGGVADRQHVDAAEGRHDRQIGLIPAQVAAQRGQVGMLNTARLRPAGKIAGDRALLCRHVSGGSRVAISGFCNTAIDRQRFQHIAIRPLKHSAEILQCPHPAGQRWILDQSLRDQPIGMGDARRCHDRHGIERQLAILDLCCRSQRDVERQPLFLIEFAVIVDRCIGAHHRNEPVSAFTDVSASRIGARQHHRRQRQRQRGGIVELRAFPGIGGGGAVRLIHPLRLDQCGDQVGIGALADIPVLVGPGLHPADGFAQAIDRVVAVTFGQTCRAGPGQRARRLWAVLAFQRSEAALCLHEQRLGVGIALHRQQHGTQILQGEMEIQAVGSHRLTLDGDGALQIIQALGAPSGA